ncbi:MAG: hypothetical protein JEZ14_13100 [Marinilabiliaceae bacterium]|nr:hypothetical protein [Marinilabiliaceae bacterium]
MKRIIYILSLIFLSTGLFAQEGEKLPEYCRNFSYKEIESGLNDFQKESTEKIAYKWHIELERELINDFIEQIIEFTKEVQDEDNPVIHTIYTHKIKLIRTKVGNVAFYKVIKLKNIKSNGEWIPTEIVLKEDSNNSLKQLEIDFKNAYSQPLNFEELFVTDIVYGNHCGDAGMEPIYRDKMNKLVESKDTTTLIKWLRSATIEIQLYAIDGILTLKQEGVDFDQPILDLIELIEKKEGSAYTCSGCIHWNQPIGETIERIKKHRAESAKFERYDI